MGKPEVVPASTAVETRNIYQRINAVRRIVGYIQKDKSVSTGAGSYMAVTHDNVVARVRDALIENGVITLVSCDTAEYEPLVATDGKKPRRMLNAMFIVEFVNEDDPCDRIMLRYPASAEDSGDKAPGKAISYAMKYAILKTFNLETGEDEEGRYSEYDFADALNRAEASDSPDVARAILEEAKANAVRLKDTSAAKAISTVGKRLAEKFGSKK
jgi:hypothetical protein